MLIAQWILDITYILMYIKCDKKTARRFFLPPPPQSKKCSYGLVLLIRLKRILYNKLTTINSLEKKKYS